ncbi:hypothetical protein B0H14DRAFT_2559616 [Mycena olivaceomarginata]|nr:hypothetical protein B0H14DRAFT_2559616 [Mycena olivaceomarginata]
MSSLQRRTGHAPAPAPACQCTLGWHRDSSLDAQRRGVWVSCVCAVELGWEDGALKMGAMEEEKQQRQNVKGAQLDSLEKAQKCKRISPYPMYQCRGALLKDFGTLLHNFIEVGNTQPSAQATFDFIDYDVVAHQAAIALGVHDLKNAIAGAGGLDFGPTSWVSLGLGSEEQLVVLPLRFRRWVRLGELIKPSRNFVCSPPAMGYPNLRESLILDKPGGVATRFVCVHSVACRAWTKSTPGELEIVVLPDDSHKYFPGERTIVRFRLVG